MAGKGRQANNARALAQASESPQDAALTSANNTVERAEQLTPYQRMQEVLASRSREPALREISTVDDLRALLKENPKLDQVVLRLKLLWGSDHNYKQLSYTRLHFIDADNNPREPFEEVQKTFRDNYADNPHDVDSLLFTATIWNINSNDRNLPPPGAIVRIAKYSNLGLFRERRMPKKQGSSNYTYEEQLRLIKEVGENLPIGEADWDAVGAAFNKNVVSRSRVRTVDSLKRKFNSLWRAFERTHVSHRTTLQVLSRNVKCQIEERAYRRRYGGAPPPPSTPDVRSRTVQIAGQMAERQTVERQWGDSADGARVSSSYIPSMKISAGVAGGGVHETTSTRTKRGESPPDGSGTVLDVKAVEEREHHSECHSDGQCGSFVKQFEQFQKLMMHELRSMQEMERKERKRERKHALRAYSRQFKQLQECLLTLTS